MPKTFDGGEPLRDQLPVLTNQYFQNLSRSFFVIWEKNT